MHCTKYVYCCHGILAPEIKKFQDKKKILLIFKKQKFLIFNVFWLFVRFPKSKKHNNYTKYNSLQKFTNKCISFN